METSVADYISFMFKTLWDSALFWKETWEAEDFFAIFPPRILQMADINVTVTTMDSSGAKNFILTPNTRYHFRTVSHFGTRLQYPRGNLFVYPIKQIDFLIYMIK